MHHCKVVVIYCRLKTYLIFRFYRHTNQKCQSNKNKIFMNNYFSHQMYSLLHVHCHHKQSFDTTVLKFKRNGYPMVLSIRYNFDQLLSIQCFHSIETNYTMQIIKFYIFNFGKFLLLFLYV